jgi:hypothetical protein
VTSPARAPEVPGYAVLGLIGSGGLGSVWRARSAAGADVAIKVVEPRRPVDAAVADRLFRREALAALNLDHPGIVRALDAVKARDGRPCIVFELAGGPTLRASVKERGAIPPGEALRIASALAAALDHAHRHGVVHGDVAPGNVVLSPEGARLLDFGLVAEMEAEPGGSVWATPGFTAPEVLAGGAPTASSDLHALGKTLAFALQGAEHPLRAVVERLCRDDPAARYRSAAELGLDLDALASGETPLGAALAGAKARMAARRRAPWILAGAALAVAAGLLLLGDRAPAPAPEPPPVPAAPPPPDPLAGRIEALRVLLGREPVDFGAARALGAEIRAGGRPDPLLAELDARWREAAAALAERKAAEAREALAAGDLAAWRRALREWPAAFADAPEAAAMAAEAERSDAAARTAAARAEAVLAGAEAALAAGLPADPAALDADLARLQEDPATPPELRRRAGVLRAKAGALAAEAARAAREEAIRRAVWIFLEAAAAPAPAGRVQERLREAIAVARGTDTGTALEELRDGAARAEEALARALGRLRGRPWAAVIDGSLFVGIVEEIPLTEAVFLPVHPSALLLEIVPDRSDLASWLAVKGLTGRALWLAPPGSPLSRALPHRDALTPYPEREMPAGPVPVPRELPAPSTGRPAVNEAKKRAVDAYLADDLPGAWRAIEESLRMDDRDAEVHVLAARVLRALASPLPTWRVTDLALREALKAGELDPSLHSARKAVIEIALEREEADFRAIGENTGNWALVLALEAMKDSLPSGHATPREFVELADRLLRSGQKSGAKRALAYARDAKAVLPAWAEEILR